MWGSRQLFSFHCGPETPKGWAPLIQLVCSMIGMGFNVCFSQVPLAVQMTDKYVITGTNVNETKLKITHLLEDDQGTYRCHAVFPLGEVEDHLELVVLSYLVPLKPFLAIAAEVVILVTAILLCEMYTQKKKSRPGRVSFHFFRCHSHVMTSHITGALGFRGEI